MVRRPDKFADVEIVRGLAAFAVVIYHFLRAYMPPGHAPEVAEAAGFVVEPPFVLSIVNGPFMVTVFFVLSSYVLTTKLVRSFSPRATVVAIVKRFPRLFPLTLAGVLLPAVLFSLGLMMNLEAAELTGSHWLPRSGGVKLPPNYPEPSFLGALKDSILLFGRGYSLYNSALWSMKYELFGSMLALATALAIAGPARFRTDLIVTLVIGVLVLKIHPLCSICVGTVFVTKYLNLWQIKLDARACFGMIVVGLALGSTYNALPGDLAAGEWVRLQAERANWFIHGLGAILLFLGVRCWKNPGLENFRLGHLLGRLSFPIYVLHIPVQASVAGAVVVALGFHWSSVAVAFVASTAVLFILASGLARFDEWWVLRLGDFTRWASGVPARTDTATAGYVVSPPADGHVGSAEIYPAGAPQPAATPVASIARPVVEDGR
jgi:peptidoglycan/LPS O-acetylase OafA/YrhL